MPIEKTCEECKGAGQCDYLVSVHDDKVETSVCNVCNGKGTITEMTEKEEDEYRVNYW